MNKCYGGISLDLKKNLREIVKKVKKMNDKEKIINIAFVGIIGVAMVFAANFFDKSSTQTGNEQVQQQEQQEQPATTQASAYKDYQNTLKNDLKSILGQIEGVGEVDVMISFRSPHLVTQLETARDLGVEKIALRGQYETLNDAGPVGPGGGDRSRLECSHEALLV